MSRKQAIKQRTNTAKAAPLLHKQRIIDEVNVWMQTTDYNNWLMRDARKAAMKAVRLGEIAG